MQLQELETGTEARIETVEASGALKERLLAFGVRPGESVKVTEHSLLKGTLTVRVGQSRIALRENEAACITVVKETR